MLNSFRLFCPWDSDTDYNGCNLCTIFVVYVTVMTTVCDLVIHCSSLSKIQKEEVMLAQVHSMCSLDKASFQRVKFKIPCVSWALSKCTFDGVCDSLTRLISQVLLSVIPWCVWYWLSVSSKWQFTENCRCGIYWLIIPSEEM